MSFPEKLTQPAKTTREDWMAEARRRFGDDVRGWRLVCPGCGHVAKVSDWWAAGAPGAAVGFSCVGRYLPNRRDWLNGEGPGPCNYTSGGLFRIAPVMVEFNGGEHPCFAFDEPDAAGVPDGG